MTTVILFQYDESGKDEVAGAWHHHNDDKQLVLFHGRSSHSHENVWIKFWGKESSGSGSRATTGRSLSMDQSRLTMRGARVTPCQS